MNLPISTLEMIIATVGFFSLVSKESFADFLIMTGGIILILGLRIK